MTDFISEIIVMKAKSRPSFVTISNTNFKFVILKISPLVEIAQASPLSFSLTNCTFSGSTPA